MTDQDGQLVRQWAQLIALTAVHFLADVFPGMMHSVLPAIQGEFVLSMFLGGVLLGTFNFASNWVQVLTGHMRAEQTRPLFMYLGLMFAAMICLLTILPRSTSSFPMMLVLALVCGSGVAIIHPEALRAIHALDRIRPATSTAVLMVGGILGFALGGKYSADLVERFGMKGLFPLAVCPIFCILTLVFLKVKLAVEKDDDESVAVRTRSRLRFAPIMAMATLAGISSSTIVWIVPQKFKEMGFALSFGGFSVMMFSIVGGLGAFFWATVAKKLGDLMSVLVSMLLGVPLMVAYVLYIEHEWAVWIFFAGSFCAFGSYPLIVSIARVSSGPRLGQRMALIVGGSWGIACLFPILLAPVAEQFGVDVVMLFSPAGYVLSCVMAVWIMGKVGGVDSHAIAGGPR